MLHWLAFVAIGLVTGVAVWWGPGQRQRGLVAAAVGALAGALVGGHGLILWAGYPAAKYPSLLTSLVLAVLVGWAGLRLAGGSKA